jgi:hypothetical protein
MLAVWHGIDRRDHPETSTIGTETGGHRNDEGK